MLPYPPSFGVTCKRVISERNIYLFVKQVNRLQFHLIIVCYGGKYKSFIYIKIKKEL